MKFVFVFLFSVLTGCSTAPFPPEAAKTNFGKLVLNQQIVIPADKARVTIQQGNIVDHPNWHDPACSLESWKIEAQGQTVLQDAFRIADIAYRQGDTSAGFGLFGSTDLGNGYYFGLGGFGHPIHPHHSRFDSPRLVQAATIMRIASEKQPLIYRLTCFSASGWAPFVESPTMAEIQTILGDLMTLSFKDSL